MRTARQDGRPVGVMAGAGEIQAQRRLLDRLIEAAVIGNGDTDALLDVAEVLARLIASREDESDRRRLAGALALRAAQNRLMFGSAAAVAMEAECLLVLDDLANDGCERAANALNTLAAEFAAGAVTAANIAAKAR